MATTPLPTTSYIILGMLTYGEMSGYDLKYLLEKSVRHFYTIPAKSQIYSELRRLESLGYATVREIPQQRRPDKWMYCITPQGQEAMRQWLAAHAVEPDSYKSPLLLKLLFGYLVSPEALMTQIQEAQQALLVDLQLCEEKEDDLLDRIHGPLNRQNLLFPLLVLQRAIARIRADLTWVDNTLEQLQRMQT